MNRKQHRVLIAAALGAALVAGACGRGMSTSAKDEATAGGTVESVSLAVTGMT